MEWRRQRETLGKRIRMARKAVHWSQQQLGEAIGVSQQEIAKYESGAHDPTPHLRSIAGALRKPVDYFYPPTPVRKAATSAPRRRGRPMVSGSIGTDCALDRRVFDFDVDVFPALPAVTDMRGMLRNLKRWRNAHV